MEGPFADLISFISPLSYHDMTLLPFKQNSVMVSFDEHQSNRFYYTFLSDWCFNNTKMYVPFLKIQILQICTN